MGVDKSLTTDGIEEKRLQDFAKKIFFDGKTKAQAYREVWKKNEISSQSATARATEKMSKLKAQDFFQNMVPGAIDIYRNILMNGSENNQFKVAQDIFDRVAGTPSKSIDITTQGDKLQSVNMNINGVTADEIVQALRANNNN